VDVVVIGAGPAGVLAAHRAAELGARTTLVTRDAFGGMAANDGPVPVRTLAHAARLVREARQLAHYGVEVGEPALDYPRLLARVRDVVDRVRTRSALRGNLEHLGVAVHEHAGVARFVDAHTVACERGPTLAADKIILCTGGMNRRLPVPGAELTVSHSHAWRLTEVPPSLLVVGAGATGAQVASIFNALGARVQLFEAAPRILMTEDEDVSAAVADGFRAAGIDVREAFGTIERFEATPGGVRMVYAKDGKIGQAEAAAVVVAIGWRADTAGLNVEGAGVELDRRGFVRIDDYLRTTAPHIFAAGDVTGRLMLVPHAVHDGDAAATNAVRGPTVSVLDRLLSPVGSFTDPEYAQVGLTEAQARAAGDAGDGEPVVATAQFEDVPRPIIDGRPAGFCKLVVAPESRRILGCHIVGERAVELAQVAAVAMAAGAPVDVLARVPLSFPTYANVLGRAAIAAARRLGAPGLWDAAELADPTT
jgi:pyruvate/2-oxoglutarate dehydrogenase complex dihydrolipoamide dehydrogenase (E3) component